MQMKINTKNEKTIVNECHIMWSSFFSMDIYNTNTYLSNLSVQFGMSPYV